MKTKGGIMKLSEYPLKAIKNSKTNLYESDNVSDNIIEEIVFEGLESSLEKVQYGLVFGTSRKIEMLARVNKAVELYFQGYLKKIIFSGGKNGVSTVKNNITPRDIIENNEEISFILNDDKSEGARMKEEAIKLGIPENDILVDEYSNNTIENIKNLKSLIQNNESIILISSSYHLKRCIAICLKYVSKNIHFIPCAAKTGYFEKENYKDTKLGRQIIIFEANHLVNLARQNIIEDLDIEVRKRIINNKQKNRV